MFERNRKERFQESAAVFIITSSVLISNCFTTPLSHDQALKRGLNEMSNEEGGQPNSSPVAPSSVANSRMGQL